MADIIQTSTSSTKNVILAILVVLGILYFWEKYKRGKFAKPSSNGGCS